MMISLDHGIDFVVKRFLIEIFNAIIGVCAAFGNLIGFRFFASGQQEQSYIGRIGKTIEPIFTPQGFDWKLDVGLVSGVGAKEIVASTMGVLYSNNDSFSDDQDYNDEDGKYEVLKKQMTSDLKKTYGYSDAEAAAKATLTAYCFLLFVLLYFPCIATIAAIKGETGSWKWAGFAAGYTTLLAWVVSALVFQIGSLFI